MEAPDEPKAPTSITINDNPPVTVTFTREEDSLYIQIASKDDSSRLSISVSVPWPLVEALVQAADSMDVQTEEPP